jgi:hypothetical protein
MIPAGPRIGLFVPASGPWSATTAVPGFAGSVRTVNGLRKPIAKISGRVPGAPGANMFPSGTSYDTPTPGGLSFGIWRRGTIRSSFPRRSLVSAAVLRAS